MTPEIYVELTDRTCKHFPEGKMLNAQQMELLHAILGMSGETGELVDGFKKHLIYDKPIDIANLREEAGDVLWYMALLFREIGVDFSRVMQENIDKLSKRYPEKYTNEAAIARADKVIDNIPDDYDFDDSSKN